MRVPIDKKSIIKIEGEYSWKTGAGTYGYKRTDPDGRIRKHAVNDIYAAKGTPVYAMADGVVWGVSRAFYKGSSALAITHADCVTRYCEIDVLDSINDGRHVKEGELIGHVMQLEGLTVTMLHLEMYTDITSKKELTDTSDAGYKRGYKRRADVKDPTTLITSLYDAIV